MIEDSAHLVDALTLRFAGENEDGTQLKELRAAHVAEVLQGVVGLTSDFAKAGVFGDQIGSEILVRPAREGSFIMEIVHLAQTIDIPTAVAAGGVPTLSQIIWWATRSMRAEVKDFDYLENGQVKIHWQDNTAQEVPRAVWEELNKRKARKKKHLRQIMAPLSDKRVSMLEATEQDPGSATSASDEPTITLTRADYDAATPDDEVSEKTKRFDIKASMSAINFDDPKRWKIKREGESARSAIVEDEEFLAAVKMGRAIGKNDIFTLRVRLDTIEKNGRKRRKWTVLKVKDHRRGAHDNDA